MTLHPMIASVAAAHGLTVADLTGPSQVRRVTRARHEAMRAVWASAGGLVTLEGLGAMFGGRCKASAAYALRRPYAARVHLRAATWGVEVPSRRLSKPGRLP